MAPSVLIDKRGNEICTSLPIVNVLEIKQVSCWSIELKASSNNSKELQRNTRRALIEACQNGVCE